MMDSKNNKTENKEKEDIHGWLIIDKPKGITSADVIRDIKTLLGRVKIGHTGTLDPMATGVLPVALGQATKIIPYISDTGKEYEFTIKWGVETDTCDEDGKIICKKRQRPTAAEIDSALRSFMGKSMQTPPAFSAIKINGKKAYELARAGEEVSMEPREIRIRKLKRVPPPEEKFADSKEYASFYVSCSQGTYVRSLARDLARKLGTCGHLVRLRRLRSGKFKIENAILLEKLKQIDNLTLRSDILLPFETVLDDISVLALSEVEARTMTAGTGVPALPLVKRNGGQITYARLFRMTYKGKLVVLARLQGASFHPARVLVNSIDIGDDDVDNTGS